MRDWPAEQGDLFDPTTITWVMDHAALNELIRVILEDTAEVVVDLETTGLEEHATRNGATNGGVAARIVLGAFTLVEKGHHDRLEQPTWLLPLAHPHSPFQNDWRFVIHQVVRAMQQSELPITNQNIKFDLRWLYAHTDVDLSTQIMWDTQLSSYLLDENASTKLKERAPDTFGIDRWDDFDLSTPGAAERVPLFDLGLYAARDTYWTWRLAHFHRFLMGVGPEAEWCEAPQDPEEARNYRLGRLAVYVAIPALAALSTAEMTGFPFEPDWAQDKIESNRDAAQPHWDALMEVAPTEVVDEETGEITKLGTPTLAPTSKWFKAWAAQQVADNKLRVVSMTPTGNPQWDKAALLRNSRAGYPLADHLLEYRRLNKQNEFLNSWLDKAVERDGIFTLHTTYNLAKRDDEQGAGEGGTVTGRTSSSNPNMQQVTAELKSAFVARPGYYVAELDFSQIELRLAAFAARCETMLEAYRNGEDLHALTASKVTGVALEDITAALRQKAKAVNFGLLFGQSPAGLQVYAETAYNVLMSMQEAEATHAAWFAAYPEFRDWHNHQMMLAHRDGFVVSPIGRMRRFDGYITDHNERQAINSPIQGFASDLMQASLGSIAGTAPGTNPVLGARILGTVHDSAVLEVPASDWRVVTGRCMKRMIDLHATLEVLGCDLDVPLGVEAKIGTRWGMSDIGIIKG